MTRSIILISLFILAACQKKDKEEDKKESTIPKPLEATKVSKPYLQRITFDDGRNAVLTYLEFLVDTNNDLTSVLQAINSNPLYDNFVKDKDGRVIRVSRRYGSQNPVQLIITYNLTGRI